jgi:hypothetical protein
MSSMTRMHKDHVPLPLLYDCTVAHVYSKLYFTVLTRYLFPFQLAVAQQKFIFFVVELSRCCHC